MDIDIGKLVGAASAPVALIIATSIFLGNLTGKYAAMFNALRGLLAEYRERHDDDPRRDLLSRQMRLYGRRLRILMRATLLLSLSILLFIGTVLLTGVSVVFPALTSLKIAVALCMLGGLLLLAWSVVMEIVENWRAVEVIDLDFDEFPELHEPAA